MPLRWRLSAADTHDTLHAVAAAMPLRHARGMPDTLARTCCRLRGLFDMLCWLLRSLADVTLS